ncbi:hypothetical protein EJB05_32203, partial [Eragrostis curvula]
MPLDLNGPPDLEDGDIPPVLSRGITEDGPPGAEHGEEGPVLGTGGSLFDLNLEPDLEQEDIFASGADKQAFVLIKWGTRRPGLQPQIGAFVALFLHPRQLHAAPRLGFALLAATGRRYLHEVAARQGRRPGLRSRRRSLVALFRHLCNSPPPPLAAAAAASESTRAGAAAPRRRGGPEPGCAAEEAASLDARGWPRPWMRWAPDLWTPASVEIGRERERSGASMEIGERESAVGASGERDRTERFDSPRYSAVTGLKTRGSSVSSAAASRGHIEAFMIHDPSKPGRAAICMNPEHNLADGMEIGVAIAAQPKPKFVSILNEANAITDTVGLPSPRVSVSTCRLVLCSSTQSTSSWKCWSYAGAVNTSRTMAATSCSGILRTSSTLASRAA